MVLDAIAPHKLAARAPEGWRDPVADHLTIYRLGREDVSASHQLVLADKIFGIKDNFTVSETNDARVLRNKNHQVVELALASGGVWAAAETELWNPAIRPDLP